jgi:glucuronosyltransferase
VMINKWIPQRDILAHSNVKVFITHGGLLGTTEALIEGKPMLGFPVFGDQEMNMAQIADRGYGIQIMIDDITEESVLSALKELLENPKYEENAKKISARFNDRPMTPKDSVVFWTEHAVRHKGEEYLLAEGRNMNFFVFRSIDSYLTIGIIFIVFLIVNVLIFICILRRIIKKKSSTVDNKKKKK